MSFWRLICSISLSTDSLNSAPSTCFFTINSSLDRCYFLSKNSFSSFYLASRSLEVSVSFLAMNRTSYLICLMRSCSSLACFYRSSLSRYFNCFSSIATSSIPSLLRRSSLIISLVTIIDTSSGSSTCRSE